MYPTPQQSPWGEAFFQNLQGNVTFNNPTTGRTFYVAKASITNGPEIQATYGSIVYPDGTPALYTTITLALASCVASRGDTIVIAPGHTETVSSSTALSINKAGVTIVGLGIGSMRPTITLDTANTATVNVTANNIRISNVIFVANFLNVASCFTLTTAADFQVQQCEFRDTSSVLNFLCIVTTSAVDNAADGLAFTNNYVYGLATTDGAVVSVLANLLRLQVSNNVVDKAATNDAGHMITLSSKIIGGARILYNILTVVGASNSAVGIFLTGSGSTSSGVVGFNNVWSLDTTSALLMTASTGLRPMQNYLSGAVDASGTLYPAADNPA